MPEALRPLVGKRELKHSLETKEAGEAKPPPYLRGSNHILNQARQGQRCTAEILQAMRGTFCEQRRQRGWSRLAARAGMIAHSKARQ